MQSQLQTCEPYNPVLFPVDPAFNLPPLRPLNREFVGATSGSATGTSRAARGARRGGSRGGSGSTRVQKESSHLQNTSSVQQQNQSRRMQQADRHVEKPSAAAAGPAASTQTRGGNLNYAAAAAKPPVNQPRRYQKKVVPMLVGTRRVDEQTDKIAAAKPYLSKAYYCIDNMALDVTVDDISEFLVDHGITVLACRTVNPQRTRWQRLNGITPKDRTTFQICIPREENGKLLNAEIWPAHTSVTAWRFSNKPRQQPQQQQQTETEQESTSAADAAATTELEQDARVRNDDNHSSQLLGAAGQNQIDGATEKDMETTENQHGGEQY